MKSLFKNCFPNSISLFFLVIFLFFLAPQQVFCQNFPEKPSPAKFVNDFAKIYSPEQSNSLEEKLIEYNNKTSTQIAIVTITSLDGYPIDDYTIKLANKWQIGQKDKNNGLLILIAKKDHKIHIASGYGMEGTLNDGKLGTIIRSKIIPQFKNGNYYAGTNDGLDAIIAATAGEYINDKNPEDLPSFAEIVVYFILFFALAFYAHKNYRYHNNIPNNLIYYQNEENRGFGSGFNGNFGGGSFGGGGAGGSW